MSNVTDKKAGQTNTVDPETRPPKSSLVELKNGKVVFKQKPLSLDKLSDTLQEIVSFRDMLKKRVANQEPALDTIPEQYCPVVAKLAHESDKSIQALAKHIRLSLLPIQDEDDDHSAAIPLVLPVHAVENTLKSIITRVNYGLDPPPSGVKVPASLCVWRWEVKEKYRDWLPKNMLEKIEQRTKERSQAKQDLAAIFKALPVEEQELLIDPKGLEKQMPKLNKLPGDTHLNSIDLTEGTSKSAQKTREGSVEAPEKPQGRPRKNIDPEKLLKEKEKLEKKAAKVEKEKKEKDAQSKSQSIMANFFTRPKLARNASSNADQAPVPGPSKVQSDFEKTFKPFVLKKDTEIAPLNRFIDGKKCKSKLVGFGAVSNRDVEMSDFNLGNGGLGQLDATERLRLILQSLPEPPSRPGARSTDPEARQFKSFNKYSVRQLVAQLSEAEIAGDDTLVRKHLAKLSSRSLIPAKVLIFKDDTRPGYFGTWTRNSRIIGPRTPFARDALMFDYAYDSGEEWEEDVQEADDVADDGEEDDGDEDEADSDLESWLVDDDDIVEEAGTPLEDGGDSPFPPGFTPPPPPASKRKPEEKEQKLGKKRKVVVQLVPFVKGPCYEPEIGNVDESFRPYRIQLFNDTPFPIDPFSFVSTPVEKRQPARETSDAVFAVPSLPDRLNIPTNGTAPAPVTVPTKKASSTPKYPFPDTHLPFLLSKIGSLATGNITFLVETVYQDLKEHKVKKNAIEAKVRDVAEKSKEKKIWVVRPELLVSRNISFVDAQVVAV